MEQQDSAPKTPLDKKSLSLPLKPLSDTQASAHKRSSKTHGNVPLTPLMAKLSVLAMGDAATTTSGPAAAIEIQTPLAATKVLPRRSFLKCDDAVDALAALSANIPQQTAATDEVAVDGLQRVALYMCGQQNMTLLLLMEEGSAHQQSIVQKMFDICVAKFPHMESQLNQTLNVNVEGDRRDGSYSFMCVDSKWDTLQRNGLWNPFELQTLESMHHDMRGEQITDLVLRCHDTVVYGYKSGRTELYYKEPANSFSGIPPPSDPMGNIAMRAKSCLERDHSYVLF